MSDESPKKGLDVSQETARGRGKEGVNHLLAIGINDYEHWNPLNNAVKDVQDMVALLQTEYHFEEEHTTTLLNEEATRDNIIDALEHLTRPEFVKPEDNVLIYYSGHGHVVERGNEKKRGFWVPVKARRGKPTDLLRNSTIRVYLEDIPAQHILLISDACFSGSLLVRGQQRSDASLEELRQRPSRWGLCSGRDDEAVADGPPGSNSPFAAAILQELNRNQSSLNIQKLAAQVVDETRRNYRQLPEGAPIYGVGDRGGQFIFDRRKNEQAIWKMVKAKNTIAALQGYIATFPEGKYLKEARQRLAILREENAWDTACKRNTLSAYNRYLLDYPEGRFAIEALSAIRELEEEADWKRALRSRKLSAFHQYLWEYPNGKYAEEARNNIKAIHQVEEEQLRNPPEPPPKLAFRWGKDQIIVTVQDGALPLTLSLFKDGNDVYRHQLRRSGEHRIDIKSAWREDAGAYLLKVVDEAGRQDEATLRIDPPPKPKPSTKLQKVLREIADNLVYVSRGSFTMGCKEGRDQNCHDSEKPPHPVKVPSFRISKYEVTQRQWRVIMGSDPPELKFKGFDDCPVETVSWDDVQEFLEKLNQLSGENYRLPTEAEWEFAARGGNESKGYPYAGSNDLVPVGWYDGNSGKKTHPVGEKRPNELGLYDMSGNVWEWCQDCWNNSYTGAPTDGSAWLKGNCNLRVLRGGSWDSVDYFCRVANRNGATPDLRYSDLGFRLARS